MGNNLIGSKFGKLTVLAYTNEKCNCICKCGSKLTVNPSELEDMSIRSCGCIEVETRQSQHVVKIAKTKFLREAKSIYKKKYDYSAIPDVELLGYVNIFCKEHFKFFRVMADSHIHDGHECPYCDGTIKE